MKKILLLVVSAASVATVRINLDTRVSCAYDGLQAAFGVTGMDHRLGSNLTLGSTIDVGFGGIGSYSGEYTFVTISPKIKFGSNNALLFSFRTLDSESMGWEHNLYLGVGYQKRLSPDSNTWLEFSYGHSGYLANNGIFSIGQFKGTKQEFTIGLRQHYFDYS